jgi:hypothetical protein
MKLATRPIPQIEPTEEELYKFGAVGCGINSIAAFYGVSTKVFYDILLKKPKLWQSLKKGEFESNVTVQSKAFEMAVSGEQPAMTIFWLKTRCGFREEPIFNFIVQRYGVKEPKNLSPEQMEEVYRTACDVLEEKKEKRAMESARLSVKRRKKSKASSLQQHLNQLEEIEKKDKYG